MILFFQHFVNQVSCLHLVTIPDLLYTQEVLKHFCLRKIKNPCMIIHRSLKYSVQKTMEIWDESIKQLWFTCLAKGWLNKQKPASYKVCCFLSIIEVQLEQQTIPSEVRCIQ